MFKFVKSLDHKTHIIKYTTDFGGKRLHDVFPVILDDENEEIIVVYCPNGNGYTLISEFAEEYMARVLLPSEVGDPSICEEVSELKRQLLTPKCWRPAPVE